MTKAIVKGCKERFLQAKAAYGKLRQQAIGLGIKVDKRWTDETVQRKIDAKLAE